MTNQNISRQKLLSTFNTVLSLVFPPSFILFITYYDFQSVAFIYFLVMLVYIIILILIKQNLKEISTPIIYFCFLLIAYLFSSIEFVKLIPAIISGSFFMFFLKSYIKKEYIILTFANKFFPNKLDLNTQNYIASSDGYWSIALAINTLFQIFLVFYEDNELWAFYSSVGWYIYLLFVFILHFLYGKFYILKNKEVL